MGQTLTDRVQAAKTSGTELDALLKEYRPFILSVILKSCPKAPEDYVQAGMLAFAQAVQGFDPGKGSFLSFAKLLISRRVIDCIRRDAAGRETPLLDQENEESRAFIDVASQHAHRLQSEQEARREEIRLLAEELQEWSISFQELAQAAPRHDSTRKACKAAVYYLLQDTQMLEAFQRKRKLPVKVLAKALSIKPKVLEDHRRYLVAAVLVHRGDYPYIREYIRLRGPEGGGQQ